MILGVQVIIITYMRKKRSMTEALRREVEFSKKTIYAIAGDTGLQKASLIRFMAGESSLRLDKADILAAYLGLELVRTRARGIRGSRRS